MFANPISVIIVWTCISLLVSKEVGSRDHSSDFISADEC